MNRQSISQWLFVAILLGCMSSTALADADLPGSVNAMDQACLDEYHQRAVDTDATVELKMATVATDQLGEGFLVEYEERAADSYASIQPKPATAVVDQLGEGFLAEYHERAVEQHRSAQSRIAGTLTQP